MRKQIFSARILGGGLKAPGLTIIVPGQGWIRMLLTAGAASRARRRPPAVSPAESFGILKVL
jgi:hypothetical protein